MRTALRRAVAGPLAYVVSYVVVGLATVPRVARYLTFDPGSGTTALEAYRAAGSPLWQAVGWFTLNAHGVPVTVSTPEGNVVTLAVFLRDAPMWLGVIPGWLGLVPMVACLLVGAAVTVLSRGPSPVPLSVGAYMVPGYLLALLVSTVAFSGAVGPVDASAALLRYPADRWMLPSVLAPLVFGSLGSLAGQSSLLESVFDGLSLGSSLR